MSGLPAHASKNICRPVVDAMRELVEAGGDLTSEETLWLFDELKWYDTEYESMRQDAEHWHNEVMRRDRA